MNVPLSGEFREGNREQTVFRSQSFRSQAPRCQAPLGNAPSGSSASRAMDDVAPAETRQTLACEAELRGCGFPSGAWEPENRRRSEIACENHSRRQ
jgi:hypothetical protein